MARQRTEKIVRPFSTARAQEKAIVVGVHFPHSEWAIEVSLDELERLAHTAGAEVVARVTQRLDHHIPRHLLGRVRSKKLPILCRC